MACLITAAAAMPCASQGHSALHPNPVAKLELIGHSISRAQILLERDGWKCNEPLPEALQTDVLPSGAIILPAPQVLRHPVDEAAITRTRPRGEPMVMHCWRGSEMSTRHLTPKVGVAELKDYECEVLRFTVALRFRAGANRIESARGPSEGLAICSRR